MKIVSEQSILKKYLAPHKEGKIAFIPTMGNLHEGHLSLVRHAKKMAPTVVVSIFVNPLQFGPTEDFDNYPRTLEADIEKLSAYDISFVFAPTRMEMYAKMNTHTIVHVPNISEHYCGHSRPNFFKGVTTIVTKLFNVIQPNFALFGEKDFQQLHIIKQMVRDLFFPIEIVSVPTVRESDGLAMSSRNNYLTPDERKIASQLYQTLCQMKNQVVEGKQHSNVIAEAYTYLEKNNFKVDYIHICEKNSLRLAIADDKELIILVAAYLGKTRLIDNIYFSLEQN